MDHFKKLKNADKKMGKNFKLPEHCDAFLFHIGGNKDDTKSFDLKIMVKS